jgi:hypothetical protein
MPDTIDDAQEHPIIFNEWSIQRILAGEKTQTRRIVNPQPPDNADRVEIERGGTLGYFSGDTAAFHDTTTCPYGQPGDVLWCREAFRLIESCDPLPPSEAGGPVKYCADGWVNTGKGLAWGKKRPSIHMPRELCRLRLRVEDVRVERVQEISPQGAYAEGIEPQTPNHAPRTAIQAQQMQDEAMVSAFQQKWNDIHGDGAWERNDWVWVIEFARYDE